MNKVFVIILGLLCAKCDNTNKNVEKIKTNSQRFTAKISQQNILKRDTLVNNAKYLIIGNKKAKIKIVKIKDSSKYKFYKKIITYKDDLILGKNIAENNLFIFRKYHPQKTFLDYKVDLYKGKLKSPNFNSNIKAKIFNTRITEACAEGVNFAGNCTLVTWGCGTACQSSVIVNRETGKISPIFVTSFGLDFKKNSRLLIKNKGAIDYKTNLIEVLGYGEVLQEIWNGKSFKIIK